MDRSTPCSRDGFWLPSTSLPKVCSVQYSLADNADLSLHSIYWWRLCIEHIASSLRLRLHQHPESHPQIHWLHHTGNPWVFSGMARVYTSGDSSTQSAQMAFHPENDHYPTNHARSLHFLYGEHPCRLEARHVHKGEAHGWIGMAHHVWFQLKLGVAFDFGYQPTRFLTLESKQMELELDPDRLPLFSDSCRSVGILSTSAINQAWGLSLWNQWTLLTAIKDRYDHPSARFAVFVCAAAWYLLTLGTNIASNLIAFGADSAMLFPRYLDMRRGQILCLILCWPIFPWKILATATTFNNFLSGYGLFMGGISGVMIADYYIWTKGNVFLPFLYNPRDNTHYTFTHGWNVQAYIAYLCAIALPFAGFCGKLGATVSKTAVHLYDIGWLMSFFVSMFVYSLLCALWRTQNQKAVKVFGLGWEQNVTGSDFDFSAYKTDVRTIVDEDLLDKKIAVAEETVEVEAKGGSGMIAVV